MAWSPLQPSTEFGTSSINRLHCSGWSFGDFTSFSPVDPKDVVFVVSGVCGENVMRVEGRTPFEAWTLEEGEAGSQGTLAEWGRLTKLSNLNTRGGKRVPQFIKLRTQHKSRAGFYNLLYVNDLFIVRVTPVFHKTIGENQFETCETTLRVVHFGIMTLFFLTERPPSFGTSRKQ